MVQVLVVYESFFGNTRELAMSIAAGADQDGDDVTVVPVASAPASLSGVDLLILGAPTHLWTLSTSLSRWFQAQYWGDPVAPLRPRRPHGRPIDDASLRSWLTGLPREPHSAAAVFDTRMPGRRGGGAAATLTRLLRSRGQLLAGPAEHFVVAGITGPLAIGGCNRAKEWGSVLVAQARVRQAG